MVLFSVLGDLSLGEFPPFPTLNRGLHFSSHFFVVDSSLFHCQKGARGHLKPNVPSFPGNQFLLLPLDYYCGHLFIGPQALFLFAFACSSSVGFLAVSLPSPSHCSIIPPLHSAEPPHWYVCITFPPPYPPPPSCGAS